VLILRLQQVRYADGHKIHDGHMQAAVIAQQWEAKVHNLPLCVNS